MGMGNNCYKYCNSSAPPFELSGGPTPSPSQEGNTKSPLLGGDLGGGDLLPNI